MKQRPRSRNGLEHLRRVWRVEGATTDLIAIDPGDIYTGVTFFKEGGDGWYCQDAVELGWEEFIEAFAELIFVDKDWPRYVVFERFRLYGDKAQLQKGSEFLTSQLIGIIKFIVWSHNRHADTHAAAKDAGALTSCEMVGKPCAEPGKEPYHIELISQMADIKKPTAGVLRTRKIRSVAKPIARESYGGRDHVVDAELHGWHHVLNTLGGQASLE